MVLEAARLAASGLKSAEIVERLKDSGKHIGVYFAMESLENARKGGRVGAIRVLAADILHVKPVLEFRDGLVRDVEIVHGYSTAVEHVIARYRQQARFGEEVFVFHSDREELAEKVKEKIYSIDPKAQIHTGWVSGVIGIYTGAGCIGIAFHER
jgi:DegV family protein with EDD domain